MAVATANCTCKKCGAKFTKSIKKYNRRQADDWERWAEANYDICPTCYGKAMREAELKLPPTVTINIHPFNNEKPVSLVWSGNTMPVKDQISALGYNYGEIESPGTFGILDTHAPRKAWYMNIEPENLEQVLVAASGIPEAIIKKNISQIDIVAYLKMKEKRNIEKTKKEAKISELGSAPEKPECWPQGRWNGKIYGNLKNGYRIYIDNVETKISAEDAKAIEQYQKAAAEYKTKINEIK